MYRSGYALTLKENQGGAKNEKMVENQYTLNYDLNVPSRKKLKEAYDLAMKDDRVKKEACVGMTKIILKKNRKEISEFYKKQGVDPAQGFQMEGMSLLNDFLKEYGSYTPEETFNLVAKSMGPSHPIVKYSVMNILSAEGYNAMVDEAGVGGVGKSVREGVEPLIIFDGERALTKTKEKELNPIGMELATNRHAQWYQVANSKFNKKKPW